MLTKHYLFLGEKKVKDMFFSDYNTSKFDYTKEEFDKLSGLMSQVVEDGADQIFEAIKHFNTQ